MHLLEGVAAILVAVSLYAWAYGMHHRPASPDWAKSQLFASIMSLVLVGLVPLGAGLVALGLSEPFGTASQAGLAALVVAPWLLWRVVRWAVGR